MQWIIPGTTLTAERENADRTDGLFQSMFLAGGLCLNLVGHLEEVKPKLPRCN